MNCGIIYTDEPEKNGSVLTELLNTQEKFRQLENTVNNKIENINSDIVNVKKDVQNNSIAINTLSLKPAITKITESGNVLNINSGMTVENNGDVAVGKDLDVDGNVIVNDLDNLRDKDGNSVADIKSNVSNLSNPNLLINGDFRVNQRGQSQYTFEGAYIYKRNYIVDRWYFSNQEANPTTTIDVGENSITINSTHAYDNIQQRIEDFKSLQGKKVTFSANIKSFISSNITIRIQADGSTVESKQFLKVGINSITATLPATITSNLIVQILTNSPSNTVEIAWAKLEIGEIATPFSPRPYAEELAMCQRYYQRLNGMALGMFSPISNVQIRIVVQFKTEMRTTPTMNQLQTMVLYNLTSSQSFSQSSINLTGASVATPKSAMIAFGNFSDLTLGHIGYITTSTDLLELDAEIYN